MLLFVRPSTAATAPPPVSVPVITSNAGGASAAINVVSGSSFVATIATTGYPAPTLALSGTDANDFQLVGNQLEFLAPSNVAAPTDADTNNVYAVTVTATNSQGADSQALTVTVVAVAPGVAVTTFQMEEWNTAASTGFARIGLPFKKGDIPAGNALVIKRGATEIAAQFDERSTWSDGSLKFAVGHIRESAFTASESKTLTITKAAAYNFDNVGVKTLTDITAAYDFKVEVSNITQFDGSTTVTRGSGSALASFNAHAAVATRVTKIHSGPVCEGWMVWGMFKDGADGSGAEDAHLKAIWYVDIWKNADGTIADVEFACVLSQDWWAVANKYRLNYTAILKNGASTIETYATVQHPYKSQWATVRKTADNNHARRHWVTAVPTLNYKPDKDYWVSTKLIPPLDTAYTPNSNATIGYTATYTPCSSMNHRAGIDATGAYAGRGMMTNPDCVAFMRQTAADMRHARTNAFAGLHVPYHYRSEATRTRPSEAADIANTVLPLILLPNPTSNWTADGMPAAGHWYAGTASWDTAFLGAITYVAPTGGAGVWTTSVDATHAVAYSYFAYLHEGERYFMEAQLDLATNAAHQQNGNVFAAAPNLTWYEVTAQRTALSIPSTRYTGIASMRGANNIRMIGFSHMLLGYASAVVPDADPQRNFIRAFAGNNAHYAKTCLDYTPANVLAIGTFNDRNNSGAWSPWMQAFSGIGAYTHYNCTEDINAKVQGDHFAKVATAAFLANQLYFSATYHALMANKTDSADPLTNPYRAHGNLLTGPSKLTAASNVFTLDAVASGIKSVAAVRNGDELVFVTLGTAFTTGQVLPSGYTAGTILYVINASGMTFQLSATVGGSAISYTNGTYYAGMKFAALGDYTVAQNPPNLPNADDYSPVQRNLLVLANRAGNTAADAASVARADTFLAPVDNSNWVTWRVKA